MKQILKTTLLEYDKSTFLIDLVKHDSEKLYVSILQTIQIKGMLPIQQEIKINPSVLADIIATLKNYEKHIPQKATSGRLTEIQKSQIQKRYLKGISISDLTIQFDCSKEIIQQILRNNGIEILTDKEMKEPEKFWRKRKKR